MNTIKIKFSNTDIMQVFDVETDKLIYVLSKLENNDELKFESQEQIEKLMEKYGLFDEYFLKNVNKL